MLLGTQSVCLASLFISNCLNNSCSSLETLFVLQRYENIGIINYLVLCSSYGFCESLSILYKILWLDSDNIFSLFNNILFHNDWHINTKTRKGWITSLTLVLVQIKKVFHKNTNVIFSTCEKYVKYTKTFYANSVKQFSPFSKTIFTSTHIHTYWNDES